MLFYFHAMKMSLKRVLLAIIIETSIAIAAAQINLAQQGVALQSSTYPNYPANLAIEGPANNKFNDGCSVTDMGKTYAWWGLQLPAVAFMTNILIYYREYWLGADISARIIKTNTPLDDVYYSIKIGSFFGDKKLNNCQRVRGQYDWCRFTKTDAYCTVSLYIIPREQV